MKRRSCTLQPGSGLKLPRHKVDQVVVQMGNDGTNDPVSLEVRAGQANTWSKVVSADLRGRQRIEVL